MERKGKISMLVDLLFDEYGIPEEYEKDEIRRRIVIEIEEEPSKYGVEREIKFYNNRFLRSDWDKELARWREKVGLLRNPDYIEKDKIKSIEFL